MGEAVARVPAAPRRTLLFIVSEPSTAETFLAPHFVPLNSRYEVFVAARWKSGRSGGTPLHAHVVSVPLTRKPRLWHDMWALLALTRVIRKLDPWAVHSVTPKAGLLGMTAARMQRVPVRVHWFTGQVWATRTGLVRRTLRSMDRLISRNATNVLVDSPAQRSFLEAEGVLPAGHAVVLGAGSICGVDTQRFRPDPVQAARTRDELGYEPDAKVVLFLGRVCREKGVPDLIDAWALLPTSCKAELLIVGAVEDEVGDQLRLMSAANPRISIVGPTSTPERYIQAADVLCLPSKREGFGMTVIEAAACGIPSVVSDIYGLKDAVIPGITGMTYRTGDVEGMANTLEYILMNDSERRRLGRTAQARVQQLFRQETITAELLDYYESIETEAEAKGDPLVSKPGRSRPFGRLTGRLRLTK